MNECYRADSFGFTEYAVVLHAGVAQLAAVRAFRHGIGLHRAMYEAHVTVKGTFRGVTDLHAVRIVVENAAKQASPLVIEFSGQPYEVPGGLLLPVQCSVNLMKLYSRLEEALWDLSRDAYEMGDFRPHLTLCYGCTSEQLEKAKERVSGVDLGSGFMAGSLDLMARTGDPLDGGYCTLIDSFPVSNAAKGRQGGLKGLYRVYPGCPED